MSLLNTIKGSCNVITGCGSGLGKATMMWLLRNDCGPILAIDRKFDLDFEKNLTELTESQKSKISFRTHDTFDTKVEASLAEFVAKHKTIDNLINVAGVSLAFALYSHNSGNIYDLGHVNNLVNFNTVGTFNMIRLVSKYMIDSDMQQTNDRPTKCIINTSCISTSAPTYGQTFYAGSKASIDSLTLCVARELSPFNIRCNTINVGYFNTPLLRSSDVKVMDHITSAVALCPKRLGEPDEFSHLVQAIIENQMLNGCCIKLDGGSKEAHI